MISETLPGMIIVWLMMQSGDYAPGSHSLILVEGICLVNSMIAATKLVGSFAVGHAVGHVLHQCVDIYANKSLVYSCIDLNMLSRVAVPGRVTS